MQLVSVCILCFSYFWTKRHKYVAMKLITLNSFSGDILELAAKKAIALFSGLKQEPHDRVSVDSGDSLNAPYAHSFKHQFQDRRGLFDGQAHGAKRLCVIFCEGFPAL